MYQAHISLRIIYYTKLKNLFLTQYFGVTSPELVTYFCVFFVFTNQVTINLAQDEIGDYVEKNNCISGIHLTYSCYRMVTVAAG